MARRVLIKAGTSVVANDDGSPSLTRLGAIVEQIAELNHAGVEVMFVSSGAVGMGKNLLRKQARLNMSFKDLHNSSAINPGGNVHPVITHEGQSVGGVVGLTPNTSISNLLAVNEHST
jgi:delta-1-pyrroline-5-carboxylate synthetase